jgi:hypothetical protein
MPMNPRLLRPTSTTHPEAAGWANRVRTNGGTVTGSTLNAVSRFCRAIDAAAIRSKIWRVNLFCGTGLNAALVPLYLGQSRTGTQYGNTVDQSLGSPSFDSVDYNETGASSGLKGNGSSKYLSTGFPSNTLNSNNYHFGIGLRETQTGSAAFKTALGAFSTQVIGIDLRRNDANRAALFGGGGTSAAGETVQTTSLAVGDIIAAWPTFYRNGSAIGTDATASTNASTTTAIGVFALVAPSLGGTVNHTDARMNWYSIGETMTAAEVLSFYNAIAAFNTSLSRT